MHGLVLGIQYFIIISFINEQPMENGRLDVKKNIGFVFNHFLFCFSLCLLSIIV
jgi:hypothetical protein